MLYIIIIQNTPAFRLGCFRLQISFVTGHRFSPPITDPLKAPLCVGIADPGIVSAPDDR